MTDAAGLTLGMRWNAAGRGRALRAGRQGGLSVLGADERHPGARRRRGAHRHVRADARTACSTRWCWRPRAAPAWRRSTASAAPRRWRRWPTAPPRIAPVDRIVGPGNAYVAEAKRQVFGHVGIDSIAGPSEVVVLADAANDPRRVALDLLAQAEHDEAAQAILITDDAGFADAVAAAVAAELPTLPRAAIAGASWTAHGAIILVRDWDEAAGLVNRLAPEHLQLMLPDPEAVFARIRHAGAVFLGALVPGGGGRLRRRPEPRAADRAHGALRLRACRCSISSSAPRSSRPMRRRSAGSARRRWRWPRRRGCRRMRAVSRCGYRRAMPPARPGRHGHSVLRPNIALMACWRCSAKCSRPSTGLKPSRRSIVSAVLRKAASASGAWPALVRA